MRLKKTTIEQVRQALNLFDEQGALDRLRSQATNAEQWDQLIAHHLTVFTGHEIVPGTIRHLRSEINIRWHESGEQNDPELFTRKEPKALLIVSSEELGKLVDQAVEQAMCEFVKYPNLAQDMMDLELNTRQPESAIEPEEIEQKTVPKKEAEEITVSCMVA